MTEPLDVKQVVDQWVLAAEEDFDAGAIILAQTGRPLWRTVCFHAQQSAEKYIKALLVHRQIKAPRTHDIEDILNLLLDAESLGLRKHEISDLTEYAVEIRYPGMDDLSTIGRPEAQKAFDVAKDVRRIIRKSLNIPD